MRIWLTVLFLSSLVGAALSCGATCVSGQTAPCACRDGRIGAQACGPNGTYDACVCAGLPVDAGVAPPNTPPWLAPMPDFGMVTGDPFHLIADARDADGDPLALTWKVVSGPSLDAGVFTEVSGLSATFTPTLPGRWNISVVASDGKANAGLGFTVTVTEARRIDARVMGAAYVPATHRIVVVTDQPAGLLVLDPDTQTQVASVALQRAPTSLSVSPDGTTALVGHDGLVTLVALDRSPPASSRWPTNFLVRGTALANDRGWVTGFGLLEFDRDAGVQGRVGTESPEGVLLHSSGMRVYAQWATVSRYDRVSPTGPLAPEPSAWASSFCDELWSAPVTDQLVDSCGKVFRLSADAGADLMYGGTLPGVRRVTAGVETPDGARFAVVESIGATGNTSFVPHLMVFDLPALQKLSDRPLPDQSGYAGGNLDSAFAVGDAAGRVHVFARGEREAPSGRTAWMRFTAD